MSLLDANSSYAQLSVSLMRDALDYALDTMQRSILFVDILRKRGNIYLDHLEQGQPPVLIFDYEMVIDGRKFAKPVNYSLVQIVDKRTRGAKIAEDRERRGDPPQTQVDAAPLPKRPIVIIDPRAGHGPGIGGSKQDSEIGMALSAGHPVYFVMFYTEPMPGQTLLDVEQAEVKFLEEVGKRHPDAEKPAVIGNCQAGWAAALIGADRPDVVGPLVLNGSPLSYWAGVEGANPMRYKGGLIGGVWVNSLLSDLGNGLFDGANLVANFENLNPANTLWTKQYNLYAKVDTEEKRYLDFEKWWGGFFMMTREEIHFIVDSLFVGNKLETGGLELSEMKRIDLHNLKEPVVVFASSGDNITPPQQALNWITRVYPSADEIKQHQQVIVYIVHDKIGHLGIFVSSSVAKKEHKEIIGSVDMINYLSPGLYEMVIIEEPTKPWRNDYKVRFEERQIEDILLMDDGQEDEDPFVPAAKVSQFNDDLYHVWLSPFIRRISNAFTAEWIKQLHPLRWSRYLISDLNPFLIPVKTWAPMIKKNRVTVTKNNRFCKMEKEVADTIADMLDFYRDYRDLRDELLFKMIYRNPVLQMLFASETNEAEKNQKDIAAKAAVAQKKVDQEKWLGLMEKGGFVEGVVRCMLAMANADEIMDRSEMIVAEQIVRSHQKLKQIKMSDFKRITIEQSRILQTDTDKAIKALPKLIRKKEERREAFEIAKKIAFADDVLVQEEDVILTKIQKALRLPSKENGN